MIIKECVICGNKYKVCPTCEKVATFSPWRTLVCCADEYMIYSILSQYDNDRDADVAAKGLDRIGLSKKTIATYRPSVKNQITEIYRKQKKSQEISLRIKND